MDKTFGYFIFGGLLIGAMFGLIGAMAGAFIGWFIAAAVMENSKKEKQ